MNRKKLLLISFLLGSPTFSFSIPVVDIPQVIENVMTEIRNNYETLVTWKREAEEWKQEYENYTKFKLDGDILKTFSDVNNLLGKHGLSMSDIDLVNPSSQIEEIAKNMFKSYAFFDNCSVISSSDKVEENREKKICMDGLVREVQELETIDKFSLEVDKLLEKLTSLNSRLSNGGSSKVPNNTDGTVSMDKNNLEASQGDWFNSDDFSSEDTEGMNTLLNQFSDALGGETTSEKNTMKLSQDVLAGVKSVSTSVKSMKIQYRLMQLKNDAKANHDTRVQHQIYMKKFENKDAFVADTYGF